MRCPRCALELERVRAPGGLTLDQCARCGGTWYDAGELARAHHLRQPVVPGEGAEPGPARPCPACGQGRLIERTWPPGSGLRLDACDTCGGLWADRSEVRALIAALEGPAPPPEAPAAPPLSLRHVLGGLALLLVLEGVATGAVRTWRFLDAVSGAETPEGAAPALAVELLAFPAGGALIGRASSGFTLWEPALAAVPASLLLPLVTATPLPPLQQVGLSALAFALTLVGARLGEAWQGQ